MKLEDWPEHVRKYVPPGFDLDAYKGAERLNIVGWLYEAIERRDRHPSPNMENFWFGLYYDPLKEKAITSFQDDKSFLPKEPPIKSVNLGDVIDIIKLLDSVLDFRLLLAVRRNRMKSLKARGAEKNNFMFLNEEEYKHLMTNNIYISSDGLSDSFWDAIVTPLTSYLRKHLTPRGRGCELSNQYVKFRLELPDEILIEHFKNYLSDARKLYSEENLKVKYEGRRYSEFTKDKMIKFAENRVLPYLDLIYWYELNNFKKPNTYDLQHLLFPERGYELKEDSTFSKQVVRPAKWLISDEGLDLLMAQAGAKG